MMFGSPFSLLPQLYKCQGVNTVLQKIALRGQWYHQPHLKDEETNA